LAENLCINQIYISVVLLDLN